MDSESSSCNEREIILHDKIASPRKLPFQYLKEITNSFSAERVLGGGGFGVVYKAVLHNGELMAVKRLMAQMPGSQKQFENEVYHLMSLNHPNIVRCIGYCYETQNLCLKYDGNHIFVETAERLLCLEYMPKGSLDNHLADESCGLDWHKRYNIISGICYGLHYIHKEWQVNTPIIHLDLKPANILLGDNMLPKIADFGLSRLFGEQQTRDCTKSLHGTLGYMAPEYLHRGIITSKSDIFSLGVIIIEIITGYRNYPWPSATGTPYHDFVELVLKNWRKRSEAASLETDFQQIRSCLEMGLSCLESDPDKRPATTEIIERLNRLGSTNCHVGSNERSSTFQAWPFNDNALDSARNDDILLLTPQEGSPPSGAVAPKTMLTSSGKNFMSIVNDVLDQVTPMTIVHFGGTILNKFLQLFDRYVETLIKVLPGPSEDDNVVESKEPVEFKAERDAQQLALIGTAYTMADELFPAAVSMFFDMQTEKKGTSGPSQGLGPGSIYSTEYKEWKRHLQHSLDKLRDHFCRQYVLSFIYLEGKSRLDAKMYLEGNRDDLIWDSDPLPSLSFQALFGRLQQLASVAGDVLLGKEKVQKVLLSRLTETVVIWLSNEQEFWDVFEDKSIQLQPSGLQQLILDMHFLVEIAVCGRYPHRPLQQLVSVIITRAIAAFSARDVDPLSDLPEDEWFLEYAKAAIHKLMLGTSGSESDLEVPVDPHDEISDSEESTSTASTVGSEDSFASANNDDLETPVYFTDPEA